MSAATAATAPPLLPLPFVHFLPRAPFLSFSPSPHSLKTPQMSSPDRSRIIVLDTAALIAGTDNLYTLNGLTDHDQTPLPSSTSSPTHTFYTTPDVIQETRDPRARARLEFLRPILTVRPPSAEALAAIIAFAKQTGDYATLSMPDLRVIALCWMLEHELNGGAFLRQAPTVPVVDGIRCGTSVPVHVYDEWKRKARQEKEEKKGADGDWSIVDRGGLVTPEVEKSTPEVEKSTPEVEKITLEVEKITPEVKRRPRRRRGRKKNAVLSHEGLKSTETVSTGDIVEGMSAVSVSQKSNLAEEGLSDKQYATVDFAPPVHGNGEDVSLDDDVGWINEENLEENLAKDGGEETLSADVTSRVACVTTDFAMQNTMLQMGFLLLSVDGRRAIRKIKRFALRCQSCALVTTEVERLFCGRCGNASLHRVAFVINRKGVARAFINPKKKPLLRGTKYPIPLPRGGRYNKDLILCEDQVDPVLQKRLQRQREKQNVDVLDPSNFYNAGARFNPHDRKMIVGYGKRNPNEVRATSRSKS